jgi:hypothetical protein
MYWVDAKRKRSGIKKHSNTFVLAIVLIEDTIWFYEYKNS